MPGITIKDGKITIELDKAIALTEVLKFTIVVGQQTFISEEMTFEVFDCNAFVTVPVVLEGYKY